MTVRILGVIALIAMGLTGLPHAARAGVPLTRAEVEQAIAQVVANVARPESYARFLALLPALDALAPEDQARWLQRAAATKPGPIAARAAFERMGFEARPDPRQLGFVDGAADGWWAVADVDGDSEPLVRLRTLLATGHAALGEPVDVDDAARVWVPIVSGPRGLMSLDELMVPGLEQVGVALGRVCVPRADVVMRLGVAGDVAVAIDGAIVGHASGLTGAAFDQIELPLVGAAGPHLFTFVVRPVDEAPPGLRVRFTDPKGVAIDVR